MKNLNDFSGVREEGFPVHGHLELSNGLPSTLSICGRRGEEPFKSCSYVYPDPPPALDGFPSRVVVSVLFEDGLHPFLELSLLDITLAKERLPEAFFSETRFITTNIIYTNMFSNGVLMAVLPGGKLVKAPTPAGRADSGRPQGAHKAIVITGLCCTTVGFLLISLRFLKTSKHQ